MVEVLKQPQFTPVPVDEQVLVIYAVTNGFMDDITVADIGRFESELRGFVRSRYPAVLEQIDSAGELPDTEEMNKAIGEFKELFEAGKE